MKQNNGHFYKINESHGHKQNTRYIKNYKNFDEYLMDYVSYSDFGDTKKPLMSWKSNKYTIKERLF